ncbi:MAG: hypothetical protein AAGA53_10080 [Pseudomonadota bacterium]
MNKPSSNPLKKSVRSHGQTPSHCLLTPQSDHALGDNLNGPCVIEVPDWVASPMGRYYMYFAHHKGQFIRMAYAESLLGPWQVHSPGVLSLHETPFAQEDLAADLGFEYNYAHIASPNVHIDAACKSLVMYYHGLETDGTQTTRVCTSEDGLSFKNHSTPIADPYFAGFEHGGMIYGITWGARLWRGTDWVGPFENAQDGFADAMIGPNGEIPRHVGVRLNSDQLSIYFTRIGDAPERILKSTCLLSDHWQTWRASLPEEVHQPTELWEGVKNQIKISRLGAAEPMEHALRDPYCFDNHLFFAGGGESAIGVLPLPNKKL